MNDKNFYKNFFKNYGILSAIIISVFVLLFYSVKLSRKSWNENLRKSVELVLEEKNPGEWTVGAFKKIDNNLSLNAAAYCVTNVKTTETCYAVIVRVATFYGPIPAVFICDSENNVSFIGYSSVHGVIERQLMITSLDHRVRHWQEKIPYILSVGGK